MDKNKIEEFKQRWEKIGLSPDIQDDIAERIKFLSEEINKSMKDNAENDMPGYVFAPYLPLTIVPTITNAKINSKYAKTDTDKDLWGEYSKS